MEFWNSGSVLTSIWICALLIGAEVLRRNLPILSRIGLPGSITAGLLGLLLGSSGLALLPINPAILQSAVYHGLAIVFIAISLQSPTSDDGATPGAVSMAYAISFMLAAQATVGLGVALAIGSFQGTPIHPGFGLMLPLGFEQGPGQALAMGKSWESTGLTNGADIGLIVAAVGFLWSILLGLPLIAWGKRAGHLAPSPQEPDSPTVMQIASTLPVGALEILTRQLIAIGGVYLLTWFSCSQIALMLQSKPKIAAMVWGFHFVVGAVIATLVRIILKQTHRHSPLHNELLGNIAGSTVDFITCAAIAAIQISVLASNWLPILMITTAGAVFTLCAVVWLSARSFPTAPFEHCVLLFGMCTGTLPVGLALLRSIDPELTGPAPSSAVLGTAGAIIGGIPVMMILIPWVLEQWNPNAPVAHWLGFAALCGYSLLVLILWTVFGPLNATRSPLSLWPQRSTQ